MQRYSSIIFVKFVLLGFLGSPIAQETIIISDSLAAHAEILDVYVENLTWKTSKFTMGDYIIIADHRMSRTHSDTKGKMLGVKDETTITKTFSFTVTNNTADTALVTTEDRSTVQTYYPKAIFPKFLLETMSDQKFESFTAWICIYGDSSEAWVLFIDRASQEATGLPIEMKLTDGLNVIELRTVSSDPYFDYAHPFRSLLKMPAMGIEFFENGKSLCALQYYGGATYRAKKESKKTYGCMAWMDSNLETKAKLILVATMSTFILMNNPFFTMND